MAGTQEALELRSQFSWNTTPLYLLKGNGSYAEANVPRGVVFGTELTGVDGQVRESISFDGDEYFPDQRYLEITLTTTLNPTNEDLVFNRLALIRGGKSQGVYTGDFNSGTNTYTITSSVPEAWSPGDKIIVHGSYEEFTVDSVSGTSGEILTLQETVVNTATGITVSDGSGTLMVLYVFPETSVTVLQNNSSLLTFTGFSFTS